MSALDRFRWHNVSPAATARTRVLYINSRDGVAELHPELSGDRMEMAHSVQGRVPSSITMLPKLRRESR